MTMSDTDARIDAYFVSQGRGRKPLPHAPLVSATPKHEQQYVFFLRAAELRILRSIVGGPLWLRAELVDDRYMIFRVVTNYRWR